MTKSLLIRSIVAGFVSGVVVCAIAIPQAINADVANSSTTLSPATLVHNGHLTICKLDRSSYQVVRTVKMIITGYSSTPDQTDDTPFITASGKHVEDGIIANNILPFGTKVRIPALGDKDKIYTVEDRMNKNKGKYQADIWFPKTEQAVEFGAKLADVEIVEN